MKRLFDFRLVVSWAKGMAGCLAFALSAGISHGQVPENTVRIEEDWELMVDQANDSIAAPQVATRMFPSTSQPDMLFSFHLNHSTLPEEATGGLQVQSWASDTEYSYRSRVNAGVLSWNSEVVTWTQRLTFDSGKLYFSVRDLDSASFGSWQSHSNLVISRTTDLADLSDYRWQDSGEHSGASFSENRVHHLVLKRVRYYGPEGLLEELKVDQALIGQ